ncbi:MAG: serine protease [Acidobacteriaceae bacterium]|nr:serine protease [Acidobacteriaceae bacterium]
MSNAQFSDLSGLSAAFESLIARAVEGVVAVKAAPYRVSSGLAIGPDLVAVADHTLRRQERIPVHSADGQQGVATILGRDRSIDLAILKVENLSLEPLPSADAAALKAGSLAIVTGLTIDAGPSASLGIVGAAAGPRNTWRSGKLDLFLRLDVNLYPSQSGAAVVNAQGQLIGMATPGLLRHSAVAVPTVTLNRVAQELLQEGRIRHGYLGIGLQPIAIPDTLRAKLANVAASGLPAAGLMVLSVAPDSPAQNAGIQLGDILISLDQNYLGGIEELQSLLRGDLVGRSVSALLIRGGEPVQAQIVISQRGA